MNAIKRTATEANAPMRKLEIYVAKYGEDAGRKLYHALQSQAAHAGVSARRKRKIDELLNRRLQPLPLFDHGREAQAPPILLDIMEGRERADSDLLLAVS